MRTIVAAVILLVCAAPLRAQPWQPTAGHLSIGVTYTTLRTTELATPSGDTITIPRFTRQEITRSSSYGVTDRITVLTGGTAFARTAIDAFDSAGGFGDIRFGLQVGLGHHGAWTMAVRGVVQAPTGDATKGEGLLPTGTGAWEGDIVFSVGRAFGGRTFGFAEAGYHTRGLELRDTFVFNSQLGFTAGPRVTLGWNVRDVQPYDTGPIGTSVASAAGLGDGVTYVAYGPSVGVRVSGRWTIVAGFDRAAHARNLATGAAYRVGLTYAR